ncbi:MAG: CorA family divalent cation transporter [Chitinophagaceae bacterium]
MILTELKSSNNQFTWIDITGPSLDDLSAVAEKYALNHHNLQDCLEPDHLPKFEEGDPFNFIILRKVLGEKDKGTTVHSLTTKIAIFYDVDTIVTIHRVPHPDLFPACEQLMHAGKILSIDGFLLKIIAKVQQSFSHFAAELNTEIDETETRLFIKKQATESIENLYLLKRRAGLCKKLLLLTGEVVSAVQHRQKKSSELQDIRDSQIKLQVFYEQLTEDALNLVSMYMSISANKSNEVMKVLTIFSAYFLPLTFIVGVYGMNFEFMPELEWTFGYPLVIGLMVLVFILIYSWFRRKKWL